MRNEQHADYEACGYVLIRGAGAPGEGLVGDEELDMFEVVVSRLCSAMTPYERLRRARSHRRVMRIREGVCLKRG